MDAKLMFLVISDQMMLPVTAWILALLWILIDPLVIVVHVGD